jgi:hypothetical protein
VRWAVAAGVVCLLGVLLIPAKADPDLWGHLRFGLDTWRDRELAVTDPYSFTQDRPQVYHEWLGAVLLALSYQAAGRCDLRAPTVFLFLQRRFGPD